MGGIYRMGLSVESGMPVEKYRVEIIKKEKCETNVQVVKNK
jgi:hypothetical protein